MFTPDSRRTWLDIEPDEVVALYRSVTQVSVLLPGQPSALAHAVVVGYRPPGGFAVALALHLTDSGKHLVYRHDEEVLDAAKARTAAQEALAFVEEMGFLMENVAWRDLPAEERQETLSSLKVFAPPADVTKATDGGRPPADPRSQLARLLSQF